MPSRGALRELRVKTTETAKSRGFITIQEFPSGNITPVVGCSDQLAIGQLAILITRADAANNLTKTKMKSDWLNLSRTLPKHMESFGVETENVNPRNIAFTGDA